MTIRCLAIDDEPLALKQLVAYISKVPFLELAAQCQSALEARAFLENDTVDAIFCDINMPDLNGMDFVKSLVVQPLVVFHRLFRIRRRGLPCQCRRLSPEALRPPRVPAGGQPPQRTTQSAASHGERRESGRAKYLLPSLTGKGYG